MGIAEVGKGCTVPLLRDTNQEHRDCQTVSTWAQGSALDVSPAEPLGKVTSKGSVLFLMPRALIAIFCLTASYSSSEYLRRS